MHEEALSPSKELKREQKLIFEPLNIQFDENLNPISETEDYKFVKAILTNEKIVRNTTFFGCGLPKNNDDINLLLNSLIEKEEKFKAHYGIKKVFHTGLNEYIGFAGLVRHKNKIDSYNNTIVEGEVFLKEEYMGSGLGFKIEKIFQTKLEERQDIVIASIWEHNIPSIRLVEKLEMSFMGKITKCYNGKTVNANMYIKYPSSLKNPNFKINLASFFITGKIT